MDGDPGSVDIALVASAFLAPCAALLSASLRQPGLPPPRSIQWVPNPISWDNYSNLFSLLPFGRSLANSLFLSLVGISPTLATASLAGYRTSRLGPRSRRMIIYGAIAMQLIPVTALWLPRFVIFESLGMINTYYGLAALVYIDAPAFALPRRRHHVLTSSLYRISSANLSHVSRPNDLR